MKILTEFEKKYTLSEKAKNEIFFAFSDNIVATGKGIDCYYDTSTCDLFLRGVFIRNRNGQKFQIKFNKDDVLNGSSSGHTSCTEISTSLSFADQESIILNTNLKEIGLNTFTGNSYFDLLSANNLEKSMTIEKSRHILSTELGDVCFDFVSGIGDFIEIELNKEYDEETIRNDNKLSFIYKVIKENELEYIDTGYNALYWRKHNFDLYLKCPYVMKKDLKGL